VAPWLALNYLAALRPSEVVRLVRGEGEWIERGLFQPRISKTFRDGRTPRVYVLSEEAMMWLQHARPEWAHMKAYGTAVRRACGPGLPHPLRHSAAQHLSDLGVRAVMTRGDVLTPEATVHYRLVPRSSIYKTGYMMANSEGIIDRTYRGVLKAPVVLVSKTANPGIWAGNRYFQIVAPDLGWIYAVRIVDALPSTERGDGGFGSTGK
jgi:dUTPase